MADLYALAHEPMPCDVLNLEWSSRGRDREVASMICASLRQMGHTVVEGSIFRAEWLLQRHRPRLLYLADPRGAANNYGIAREARELGIPVVTVHAEGNVEADWPASYFWGHIAERQPVEQLALIWSAHSLDAILRLAPEMAPVSRVVGGVGFDRYKILRLASRDDLLASAPEDYDQVVGYAGWVFDFLDRDDPSARSWRDELGPERLATLARDREGVTAALREAIEARPRTLFVLRDHPGSTLRERNEIAPIAELPNVLPTADDLSVSDSVSGCDAWLAYESTTCLEAWLSGTPTMVIDPTGEGPCRTKLYAGSPRVRGGAELAEALGVLERTGELPGFAERAEQRQRLIVETIQWDDGRNHLRAADAIDRLLATLDERPRPRSLRSMPRAVAVEALWAAAPLLPKRGPARWMAAARKGFRRAELRATQRRYREALGRFDAEHPLSAEDRAELDRVNRSARLGADPASVPRREAAGSGLSAASVESASGSGR